MEKTKMPSKINPPRATPDQGSKGCCCRPSSKEQMGTLAEPLSGLNMSVILFAFAFCLLVIVSDRMQQQRLETAALKADPSRVRKLPNPSEGAFR